MLSPQAHRRRSQITVAGVLVVALAIPVLAAGPLGAGASDPASNQRLVDAAADGLSVDDPAAREAGSGSPTGVLEVPPPGSDQSGIGVITGWVCDANQVTIVIDGVEREAAYGTRRSDTQQICGDTNNGFGYLINWNLLGDGPHTVEALANGFSIGSSKITVATLGAPFRSGLSGTYDLPNFPTSGETTTVKWVESAQGFRIVPPRQTAAADEEPLSAGGAVGVLENPPDGSPVSGISLISGWVCNAQQVQIYIDDAPGLVAAYGTARADTVSICGAPNNGFGALINWNLLGDGSHTVRADADGVTIGEATIVVQTLGGAFLRGLSGTYGLGLFGGRFVKIEWQEAQQNFVIQPATGGSTPTPVPSNAQTPTPTPEIDEPTPTPRPTGLPTPFPTPYPTPTVKPTPRPTLATPRPTQPPPQCCKICTTGKACGDSCISRSFTCHQGPGCACNG